MEALKGSIFIRAKEIQDLMNCSRNTAYRTHQSIRDALGILSKRLTVTEYIKFIGANPQDIIPILNQYR